MKKTGNPKDVVKGGTNIFGGPRWREAASGHHSSHVVGCIGNTCQSLLGTTISTLALL